MESIRLQGMCLLLAATMAAAGTGGLAWAGDGSAGSLQPADDQLQSQAVKDELKATQDANAAVRKSKGLGRTTTSDDRKAAAERNEARKAAAEKLRAQGGQQ